jgi:hypothetical protein
MTEVVVITGATAGIVHLSVGPVADEVVGDERCSRAS